MSSTKNNPLTLESLPLANNANQLDRSLSWIGATGLAFTITNSWMSYAATFGTALTNGGGITVLLSVLIAGFAQWIVLLGVCEMVSAIPSSGGCYHFTYFLAPKKTRTFASFTVGIINLLGFWIGGVAGSIYTITSIFGIIAVWVDGFYPTQWQVYLAYVALVLLSLIPIFTIPPSKTKYQTTASLTLSLLLLTLLVAVLTSLARSQYQKTNLSLHQNRSGYPDSTAWLLSISAGMFSFSPAGTVVHLSEEVKGAGRGIPVAINTTMALGLLTTIPFAIVLLLGMQDVQAVQDAWIPSLQAFYQATGSKSVATGLQVCLVLLYFGMSVLDFLGILCFG
ncbi:uncharacterized protein APUU_80757A [Aspergillus puulaauensis]|uniref:Choline transport protein n=1 Tax=Aspergillus puulaauensis TaxID=1220207 RepID=A0A7R7XZL2_9EURO|nr:uncharacterized protein APUU_80757A [Aspergillus puulaauensis]BCS30454.1 hypothetical protein APUU_80757A [Aspergillus puulaauensis]